MREFVLLCLAFTFTSCVSTAKKSSNIAERTPSAENSEAVLERAQAKLDEAKASNKSILADTQLISDIERIVFTLRVTKNVHPSELRLLQSLKETVMTGPDRKTFCDEAVVKYLDRAANCEIQIKTAFQAIVFCCCVTLYS